MQRQHWQDAYDTQLALWRWLDTDPALTWLRQKFRAEVIDLDRDMQLLMADIYSVEYAKLRTATPFYVSGEMCEVAEAASKSFEPEALLPTDFLVPTGFLYFEKPFEILDRYGRAIQLAGFSWSPLLVAEDVPSGNATLVQSDGPIGMEFLVEHHKQTHENGSAGDGVSLCLYVIPGEWESEHLGPVPPLLPTHFTPWWYEMTFEGNEVDGQGIPTGAEQWWKIIQTTLRLMQQRLSVRHQQRATRPQRREGERAGFGSPDVTVVKLRREKSETPDGHTPSPANYSHRFFVGAATGGFWRNQPYGPKDHKVYRQIWIAPFIKGDENLPLVIKPRRAFVWSR